MTDSYRARLLAAIAEWRTYGCLCGTFVVADVEAITEECGVESKAAEQLRTENARLVKKIGDQAQADRDHVGVPARKPNASQRESKVTIDSTTRVPRDVAGNPAPHVGWFDRSDQAEPTFDPGSVPCLICGLPWTEDTVRTPSVMWADKLHNQSLFYRIHRTCDDAQTEAESTALDGRILDGAPYSLTPEESK